MFEWDAAKSEATKAARGLGFDYASTIFLDPDRLEGIGRDKDGEARYYAIGKAAFGEILFVVFT